MTLTFISKIFGIYNSPVTLLSQIPCLFHLCSWLNSHLLCEFWPIFAFVSLIFLSFNHNLCKQHDCLHWPKQCAYISMTNYFPSKDFFFFFHFMIYQKYGQHLMLFLFNEFIVCLYHLKQHSIKLWNPPYLLLTVFSSQTSSKFIPRSTSYISTSEILLVTSEKWLFSFFLPIFMEF